VLPLSHARKTISTSEPVHLFHQRIPVSERMFNGVSAGTRFLSSSHHVLRTVSGVRRNVTVIMGCQGRYPNIFKVPWRFRLHDSITQPPSSRSTMRPINTLRIVPQGRPILTIRPLTQHQPLHRLIPPSTRLFSSQKPIDPISTSPKKRSFGSALDDLGATHTMKVVIIVFISIAATVESIAWAKLLWYKFSPSSGGDGENEGE
jgi:hypothetical protein